MFPANRTTTAKLTFAIPVLILLSCCIREAQAQGNTGPSMRDQARAIQRAEMDRLLLLPKTPAKAASDPHHAVLMKQIREDFKDLQELNNKMMATAWAGEPLDYSFLSDMVSRIKGKATRLKTNLNFPSPADPQAVADPKAVPDPAVNNAGEFRNALLVLDKTIMRFVTNPLFQTPNTLEVSLATKARQDIEAVISLTTDLKKTASRLQKSANSH